MSSVLLFSDSSGVQSSLSTLNPLLPVCHEYLYFSFVFLCLYLPYTRDLEFKTFLSIAPPPQLRIGFLCMFLRRNQWFLPPPQLWELEYKDPPLFFYKWSIFVYQ